MAEADRGILQSPEVVELAGRMFDAARKGDTATFEQALPAGLPVNLSNDKGDSFLMLASYHGHLGLTQLLLEHGADPNMLNDRGQSILAGALFKQEEAIAKNLLEHGADPDIGLPSAASSAVMFKVENVWNVAFEEARQRRQAAALRGTRAAQAPR